MYMQITTKCNMKCAHCCYSCNMNGKHMDWGTVIDSISFAQDRDDHISIGGGEPTLHPRFFDILRICLNDFSYVWMATNGSKKKAMLRLSNILLGEDFPDDIPYNPEDEAAYERALDAYNPIYQEDKLGVALSLDYFHDPIDEWVVNRWRMMSARNQYDRGGSRGFEIRDVTKTISGVIKEGRAKRTGNYQDEKGCVCGDLLIRPDGKIKLCGCRKSPIIGSVTEGISEYWNDVISDDSGYRETNCYKGINHIKE